MTRQLILIQAWLRDLADRRAEGGATATEYALLVSFVAIVLVGGATLFGNALNNFFSTLATTVGGW